MELSIIPTRPRPAKNLAQQTNKNPRRLHSDTILSMSTIEKSYLSVNLNNVMDRWGRVKTAIFHGESEKISYTIFLGYVIFVFELQIIRFATSAPPVLESLQTCQ